MPDRSALACADCRSTFSAAPKGPLPVRCPPCTALATAARHRSYHGGDRPSFTCPDCGVLVTPARMGPLPTACPDCSDERWRVYRSSYRCPDPEKQRDKWRIAKAQRSARKNAQPFEAFTHREIFERDGWVCGICRDAVDPALSYPDPWSASLDHIVPRCAPDSPGHVRSNVQCSHLWCNTVIKHDHVPGGPALMIYVKHRRTGELAPADTEIAAKMMCLRGHRPLTDAEVTELNRGSAPSDEPVTTATTGDPVPPPKSGAGSGREQWHTYAAAVNVEVAPEASKDDVVAALSTAGVRTE